MKNIFHFFLSALFFVFYIISSFAQTKISGKITDPKKMSVPGANIYIKDTYDGNSSDANGNFSFITDETGEKILVVSFVGYENNEQKIVLEGKEINLNIMLKETANELNMVTISAGSFEASDEKKMVMLRPLDIVTTAGASGDIYGALQTLPGTQQVGESEGLFVRGGDASEAKTFIDGMLVSHPYNSSVPDIPQRGRFSPFLFKGTFFSTGGYSAQYGQAMSSALILETTDIPERTNTNISLMTVGGGISHNEKWKNNSLSFSAFYTHLGPYYSFLEATHQQKSNWDQPPQSASGSLMYRQKTSKTGLLKTYFQWSTSSLSLNTPSVNDTTPGYNFKLNNQDYYFNTSYKEILSNRWSFYSGLSYGLTIDEIKVGDYLKRNLNDQLSQGKVVLTRGTESSNNFRIGAEVHNSFNKVNVKINNFNIGNWTIEDLYSSVFVETDIYLSSKLVARMGARYEHSQKLSEDNIAPRISVAYKTGRNSQVSFAYGKFYQKPMDSLFRYKALNDSFNFIFERATHYILNYQYIDNNRTFRIESFYKKYQDLVKTNPVSNNGYGYARGVDVFWRDKKTIKYSDYWISYSYLDTKRDYLNFPAEATPNFASTHTFSLVYKRWIPEIKFSKKVKLSNTNIGATYTYATGRPYYNPQNPIFPASHTKDYNNLSLTLSKLTSIKGNFTVIAIGMQNILGFENVYGYRYLPNGQKGSPVGAGSLRSFFIGVFISIGRDNIDDL